MLVVPRSIGVERVLTGGRCSRRVERVVRGTWAGGERSARRTVRGSEGDLGKALAVLFVKADETVELVLDVVNLERTEVDSTETLFCLVLLD
jgi:hypothetical protein